MKKKTRETLSSIKSMGDVISMLGDVFVILNDGRIFRYIEHIDTPRLVAAKPTEVDKIAVYLLNEKPKLD